MDGQHRGAAMLPGLPRPGSPSKGVSPPQQRVFVREEVLVHGPLDRMMEQPIAHHPAVEVVAPGPALEDEPVGIRGNEVVHEDPEEFSPDRWLPSYGSQTRTVDGHRQRQGTQHGKDVLLPSLSLVNEVHPALAWQQEAAEDLANVRQVPGRDEHGGQ